MPAASSSELAGELAGAVAPDPGVAQHIPGWRRRQPGVQQWPHPGGEILVVFAEEQERRAMPAPPPFRIDMMGEYRVGDHRDPRHGPLEFEEAAPHMVPAGDETQAAVPLLVHPIRGFPGVAESVVGGMTE